MRKKAVFAEDIPGWAVLSEGALTVALDIEITDDLLIEGYARELVNKIQNIRKENNYEVTDKISLTIEKSDTICKVIDKFANYICAETLIEHLTIVDAIEGEKTSLDLSNDLIISVKIEKI